MAIQDSTDMTRDAVGLLFSLIDKRVREIKPSTTLTELRSKDLLTYMIADVGEVPANLLEYMVSMDLLTSEVYEKAVCCPTCRCTGFEVHGRCVSCGSTDFRKDDSGYLCSCGTTFDEPKIVLKCSSCMLESSIADADTVNLVKYNVKDFTASKIFYFIDSITAIKEFLHEKGFDIISFTEAKGQSGVKHMVDLLAVNKNMERALIEFWLEERDLSSEKVLGVFAKAYDLAIDKKLLVSYSNVSDTATQLASFYGIGIYKMNRDEDPNNLLTWLYEVISEG